MNITTTPHYTNDISKKKKNSYLVKLTKDFKSSSVNHSIQLVGRPGWLHCVRRNAVSSLTASPCADWVFTLEAKNLLLY